MRILVKGKSEVRVLQAVRTVKANILRWESPMGSRKSKESRMAEDKKFRGRSRIQVKEATKGLFLDERYWEIQDGG